MIGLENDDKFLLGDFETKEIKIFSEQYDKYALSDRCANVCSKHYVSRYRSEMMIE